MRVGADRGSLLITALLVCLCLSVLTAAVAAQVAIARYAVRSESEGVTLKEQAERGLRQALEMVSMRWEPSSVVLDGGIDVSVEPLEGEDGRLMRVEVSARSAYSIHSVTALVERGYDGLDVPSRAAVGLDVAYESGRALPLVYRTTPAEIAPEGGPFEPALVTVARVLSGTPGVSDLLGEGVVMEGGASWSLTSILPLPEGSTGGDSPLVVVPPGRSVGTILSGALADRGLTAETPVVLVAPGPDPLDARDRGDLFGVIVGGAGGVLLEGTVLHGAVITEGILDFGANGQVEFDATLLEWARRNSIVRTRLMPGSREDRITAIDG